MAFNTPMNSHEARKLIEASGGDIAFARLLGLDEKPGTRQRINNWKRRGIPACVVLEHLDAIDALRAATESREAA